MTDARHDITSNYILSFCVKKAGVVGRWGSRFTLVVDMMTKCLSCFFKCGANEIQMSFLLYKTASLSCFFKCGANEIQMSFLLYKTALIMIQQRMSTHFLTTVLERQLIAVVCWIFRMPDRTTTNAVDHDFTSFTIFVLRGHLQSRDW